MKNYLKTSGLCALLLLTMVLSSQNVFSTVKPWVKIISPSKDTVLNGDSVTVSWSDSLIPAGSRILIQFAWGPPGSSVITALDTTNTIGRSVKLCVSGCNSDCHTYMGMYISFFRYDTSLGPGIYRNILASSGYKDSCFLVKCSYIKILSPKYGDHWEIGKTYTIKYQFINMNPKHVYLIKSIYLNNSWYAGSNTLTSVVNDSGSTTVRLDTTNVIFTPDDSFELGIILGDGCSYSFGDMYGLVITKPVKPTITVLSPNGG